MKDEIIEFFKPDKNKVVITLLYALLLTSPYLFYPFRGVFFIPLIKNTFIFSVISYPFFCSLLILYRKYKSGNLKGVFRKPTLLSLVVLGMIIFNPIFMIILGKSLIFFSDILLYKKVPDIQSGVQIIDVSPELPAYEGNLFGKRVYGVEILRKGETVLNEKIEDTNEFYDAIHEARIGDEVRFYTIAGIPKRFFVDKNLTDLGLKVQNIGERRIPLVQVLSVKPDTPFSHRLDGGETIYAVDVYKRKEHTIDIHKFKNPPIRKYEVRNEGDFYSAINSSKPGETIRLKIKTRLQDLIFIGAKKYYLIVPSGTSAYIENEHDLVGRLNTDFHS